MDVTPHLVDKKNSGVIGRRPIKKNPMWRLRQENTQKKILTTQKIEVCSRETAYIYERKITATLNNYQTKLKPLPENPRIINSMGIFLLDKFIVYL